MPTFQTPVNQNELGMPSCDAHKKLYANINVFFFTSCGTILIGTAALKALSIIIDTKSAALLDPLFMVRNYYVLAIVAAFEIIIGITIMANIRDKVKALLIIWLAGNCVLYRLGLQWLSWSDSCQCLGSIIRFVPVRQQALDWLSLVLLAYMLVGAVAIFTKECLKQTQRDIHVQRT